MKRILALVLTAVLLLSCCSALAEYDKHITFTLNGTHTNSNIDYNHDGMYDYITGLYNFDYEVFPVSKDAQSEKIRIWINGGTMPDIVTWRDFVYQEYVTYAEQGMISPLPEKWEEKYPYLYEQMVGCMGEETYQKFVIDGACYGVAHARNYRFNHVGVLPDHVSIYYRKDWAEKLGYNFGDVITISEFASYLSDCIANDMVGNGNTLGLSVDPNYLCKLFMMFPDVDYDAFNKNEDGTFSWGFADPTVLEAIKLANEWYGKGLIDPDFYLHQSNECVSNFTSGIAAAMFHNCAVSSCLGYRSTFAESTGMDPNACVAIATIATDDGVTCAEEVDNWWSVSMFNPDIDPEVLDRILTVMNYVASQVGQLTVLLGLPGVDWEYDENGKARMLIEPDENGKYPATVDKYPSYSVFRTMGLNADDYDLENPSNDPNIVEPIRRFYSFRDKGHIVRLDVDYRFFSSDSKANYSLNLYDEVAKLVIGKPENVEADWQAYIAENEPIWKPVVDDLNAAFAK